MEILYWNILGIVLLVSFVIFVLKFYKNYNVIDKNQIDDVKMNVKIVKETQSNFNYDEKNIPNQSQKPKANPVSGSTQNQLLYVKIPSPNILGDPRLRYIGDSKDACTIYAILPEDVKYLTKGRFTILDNINSAIGDGRDYTAPNIVKKIKNMIEEQKYQSNM